LRGGCARLRPPPLGGQCDQQRVGDGGNAVNRRALAGRGRDQDAQHDCENERGRDAQAPTGDLGGVQREHQRGTDEDGADDALEIAGLSNALEEERGAER
jgi:hypothetical protein